MDVATRCADAASALNTMKFTRLPISATENDSVNFKPADSIDSLEQDTVSAPLSIAAGDVAVTPAEACVRAGQLAVFNLVPTGSIPQHECVITALASGAEVIATLRIANPDGGEVDVQVSVDIEVNIKLSCVLLKVAVPLGTQYGARVVINHVWVAGCAVVLNELSSIVTIGFNHATAPAGAMMAAAKDGDLPALKVALRNGGSTEEKDAVSASLKILWMDGV